MRASGRFPEYPLPRRAAEERLRVLERRIARLEAEAARKGWTEEAEGEHYGWKEEADGLRDALQVLDVLIPSLPRCGCFKRAHPTRESAERHAAQLRLIDDRQKKAKLEIHVYACRFLRPLPGETTVYHVGHYDPVPYSSIGVPNGTS